MLQSFNVEQSKVKTSFYAQPTVGGVNLGRDNSFAKIGLALGGELEKNGTYAKAEVAGGTYLGAKASVGHEFSIGKNMGLDLSVNGQYLKNNQKLGFTPVAEAPSLVVDTPSGPVHIESQLLVGETMYWREGDMRANAKAMFNFEGKAGKIGIGLEGGYANNNGKEILKELKSENSGDITILTTDKNNNLAEDKISYNCNTSALVYYNSLQKGPYVTPKVEAELNLGKHAKIVADADLKQQNVGFRWTF